MLDQKKLIVCVGSGGVGKTSTSAALGLRAAIRGRRVLVLTIDPARRLANSLGLNEFGNEEAQIDLSSIQARGSLSALMLDTQTTFDQLIGRLAPDAETRQKILDNAIYRTLSNTFASSQEYMATEALHDVFTSGRYDLVVLDTPPVKNALDFMEAPGRLSRFFDKSIIRWFLAPYDEKRVFGVRMASTLVAGTSAVVFRLLGYIFGKDFLNELSDFLLLFKDMYDGFRIRHEEVIELFRSDATAFLTVCAPTEPSIEVAAFFARELRSRNYPRAGVVVNQVYPSRGQKLDAKALLGDAVEELGADMKSSVRAGILARLSSAHGRFREVAEIQRGWVREVQSWMGPDDGFLVEIPRLEREVHDLESLAEMGDLLLGGRDPSRGDP